MSEENLELEQAWHCIEHTGMNLFLTGKAGTGKTTFLRKLKEKSPKRMIVLAPTGIAAINAGGVTIHSFFQLPLAPYVPDTNFNTSSHYRFSKEKVNIIRSIDLLVIDEVSMVRSDLLDSIDMVLRRYRDHFRPFGGVQLLLIGDMQQLAPVVKDDEWALLKNYYDTPFFFSSNALKKVPYIVIELKKVYRQNDLNFLTILNKIRDNNIDSEVMNALNTRYIPNFVPNDNEGYIRLTTHNYMAQRYNESKLNALTTPSCYYLAEVEGDFPELSYPTDKMLTLKKGAQVMFIKNDSSGNHRYYNGKIAFVTAVSRDKILVKGKDDGQEIEISQEEWTNSKYSLDSTNNEIVEKVEGTFKQYPLRLAWAITIHKSQGLTFDKAIIDAQASFAHGQVYVALSRCRTLNGLVLSSPINLQAIVADATIDSFIAHSATLQPTNDSLSKMELDYFYQLLCEQFDFHVLDNRLLRVMRVLDEHLYRIYPSLLSDYKEAYESFNTQVTKVGEAFNRQYTSMMYGCSDYASNEALQKRIVQAAHYFGGKIDDLLVVLVGNTRVETDNKVIRKRFDEAYDDLQTCLCILRGTLLFTEQEGFSVSSYLRHKAVLSIAPKMKKPRKSKSSSETVSKAKVATDILHPLLYRALKAWRAKEAVQQGMPAYTILQQKAIIGIANYQPRNKRELLRMPYVGEKTVEKYGDEILAIVKKMPSY